MQAILYAACGTGFTFLTTVLGAALVFLFRDHIEEKAQRACLGFAAGVMAAASVFSLLLPAMERLEQQGGSPFVTLTLGFSAGAGMMLAADKWMGRRQRGADEAARRRALMITAVTLHNIPEGMAVGLAFASAAQAGGAGAAGAAALALGIGVQNLPEGAAISLPLRQSGMSRMRSFLWGAASGIVEPLFGMLVVLTAAYAAPVMPGLMAFSAGAMMVVVVAEMIPGAVKDGGGVWFVMLGYVIMMALDVALG